MKRILSVLMALCMLLSLISCGNNNDTSSQNKDEEYISSQTEDTKTSSDSAESTSSNNTTSKTDSDKTSTSKPKTSTDDKTSDNSSKNDTTVTTSSTPVTSKINYKQATDTDNNVTVDGDGIVSITVPKWFLLKTEPDYNYQLTEEEKNTYNFTSVTKNADGSATYKIGYNDYHKFLLLSKSSVNAIVYKYKHNTWFSEINADTGYNNIKIYTKYNSLEDFDSDFGLYIAASGLQTTFYQYMNYNCSVGTTITVYNKDNVLLATYKFPDLLK